MKHDPTLTAEIIIKLIRAAEDRYDWLLCPEDFNFLAFSVEQFVNPLIDKFIAGAKEHYKEGENFIFSVDHQQEITKEILDIWNYQQAQIYCQRRQSKS